MYEPNGEQRDWAVLQMSRAQTPQVIRTAVERLLEVWWTMNHTPQSQAQVIELFSKLAVSAAILPEAKNEVWTPLKPGNVVIRDRVRVKASHYLAEVGRTHNGRQGTVVAIRGGDVIVKYDDGEGPLLDGVHHSPFALEKRIR